MEHLLDLHDEAFGIPPHLLAEVKEELRYRKLMELNAAVQEQTLAARLGNERFALQFGEQELMVHPLFYHYWGIRLGYECWKDQQFVHEFWRDNEMCRIKNLSRKCGSFGSVGPGMQKYFKKAKELSERKPKGILDAKGRTIGAACMPPVQGAAA